MLFVYFELACFCLYFIDFSCACLRTQIRVIYLKFGQWYKFEPVLESLVVMGDVVSQFNLYLGVAVVHGPPSSQQYQGFLRTFLVLWKGERKTSLRRPSGNFLPSQATPWTASYILCIVQQKKKHRYPNYHIDTIFSFFILSQHN